MTHSAADCPDLVVIGGLTVDNVVAADGTLGLGQAGGNGAYAAVGALHFAKKVGLVSQAVASYPDEVLKRLAMGGVDLSGVVFTPHTLASGTWFFYAPNGDRDERFHGDPDDLAKAGFPTDHLSPRQRSEWIERLASRPKDDRPSYGEFRVQNPMRAKQVPERYWRARGLLLAPSGPEVMMEMLERVPAEMVVIADPGWQLAGQPFDNLSPILARLDAFLPSEVELKQLFPHAGLDDALAVLADLCPGTVAVKLGPRGVRVWNSDQRRGINVSALQVEARDPTGAGDAFCGGFLAGLVETNDPVAAARFGAIAAANIVQHFGADGALPTDRVAARQDLAKTSRELAR